MRPAQNIYFTSFYLIDNNFLHGIGIFRIHPDVVEIGLVENTRELGKLQ
jgi:hypothetical protein